MRPAIDNTWCNTTLHAAFELSQKMPAAFEGGERQRAPRLRDRDRAWG